MKKHSITRSTCHRCERFAAFAFENGGHMIPLSDLKLIHERAQHEEPWGTEEHIWDDETES